MLKKGDIVELKSGFTAIITYILGDTASCRWMGSPIHFNCPVSSLRYLGTNPGPLPAPSEISLETLISDRNAKAIEYLANLLSSKRGPRKEKVISLKAQLEKVQGNPEEFKRLLEKNGLIHKK